MIAGSAVTLRALCAGDGDVLYRIASDLETWEQRREDPPRALTREAFRARFDQQLATSDGAEFAIDVGGETIGRIGLFHEDVFVRQAEVGIAMLADRCGHGYGTAAMRLMCEFAFVRRNLRRLHLSVIASNAQAIASYRKVGFVEEGRRREHAWVRGTYEDQIDMGLLRAEFSG